MIRYIIFAALLTEFGARALLNTYFDERIVGGSPVDISEVPYQVALLQDFEITGQFAQSCGGTIINPDVILSAAHCTAGTRPTQWRVRAGSNRHDQGGQVLDVKKFVQHNRFNSRNDNDICLLFMVDSLILGPNVSPIALPMQDQPVADDTPALLTGWGTWTPGGPRVPELLKVVLPIVNHAQCILAYLGYNSVTDNMICAGVFGVGGPGHCFYDNGGPLVIDDEVIGIVSWGRGCGRPEYPGVYVKVSNYRDWIDTILEENQNKTV